VHDCPLHRRHLGDQAILALLATASSLPASTGSCASAPQLARQAVNCICIEGLPQASQHADLLQALAPFRARPGSSCSHALYAEFAPLDPC